MSGKRTTTLEPVELLETEIPSDLGSDEATSRPGAVSSVTLESEPEVGSRRRMLSLAGLGAVGAVSAACVPAPKPPSPPSPPVTAAPPKVPPVPTTPATPLAAAQHLVRRATFGATPEEVARARSMGLTAWLDQQLSRSGLASAENMLGGFSTLKNSNAQNDLVRKQDKQLLFAELDHATLLRAVYSKQQLYEVMCDFWTNHFNIWRQADWLMHLKTADNETVIRGHALGKFSDLLMASAKSPAMLVYLDNYQSSGEPGKQVNENYGRELCELHTLGIIDGQHVYSEADLLGVAKVLSGWGIDWTKDASLHSFKFNPWSHNREAVSILGGQWNRPARPDWRDFTANGLADGEALIRFLARHTSTARYICTKLVKRFVSDDPPPTLVDRLTGIYSANDTAMAPVLRALFLSPEFAAASNNKLKRPIDWLYSALRVTGATVPSAPQGAAANDLRRMATSLGQPNFERVSPDGWPETANNWIGSDGLLKRWEWGATIAKAPLADPAKATVNIRSLLPSMLPNSNSALVSFLATERLQIMVSAAEIRSICDALGVSENGPADQLAANDKQLQSCVGLLLAHPNFQRR